MSEPIAPVSGDRPATQTEYVILTANAGGGWEEGLRIKAASAEAAIRSFVDGQTTEATLVAIPARSWKPMRVKPRTVTSLVIEEA